MFQAFLKETVETGTKNRCVIKAMHVLEFFTLERLKNFPCFRVSLNFKQFNRHKLWCPPQCVPFALVNDSSLSYIVIALSSEVTYLSHKNLNFP